MQQPLPSSSPTLLPSAFPAGTVDSQFLITRGPLRGLPRRPSTDRRRGLHRDQVTGIINAAAFAKAMEQPLNTHLVVVWRHLANFQEDALPGLQTRFLDRMNRWLTRRGVPPVFVWVRERSPGQGIHTHIAFHLPTRPEKREEQQFAQALVDYLVSSMGFIGTLEGNAPIRVSLHDPGRGGKHGPVEYLLKGMDHDAVVYLGPEPTRLGRFLQVRDRGPQGIIDLKRCGTSQNLGFSSRQKAGWLEVRDILGLNNLLHATTTPQAPSGPERIRRAVTRPSGVTTPLPLRPPHPIQPTGTASHSETDHGPPERGRARARPH